MLARFEVAAFDRLLRGRDALGNHLRLNRDTLLHAEALHQRLHFVAGEDAHQIVFKRKEETRRSRIALAAGAPAQLVVDAPRLVPFSAEDVQTAALDHFFVL